MKILVTGGAGFIGSNFLLRFAPAHPEYLFVNADKLTYAANLQNLAGIATLPNYKLERTDIVDRDAVRSLFLRYRPDWVIHLAAETHVDRSILGPAPFIQSNIVGTFNLLEACREFWENGENHLFHHVSTDEVYGPAGPGGCFTEASPNSPTSPYAASKASSDHLVRAYYKTYRLPVKISNCSNNYGPRQFPEKLIPLMILNATEGKPLPVYGNGQNERDWLYVEDHCEALWRVATEGKPGETYNIAGNCLKTNLEVVRTISQMVAEATGRAADEAERLIAFVSDRPGHDLRYALDCTRIQNELGWTPRESFETGLRKTVEWYLGNMEWVDSVRSGEYWNWIGRNYVQRKAR